MKEDAFRLVGTPRFGGILVVSDHASARVPDDIALGVDDAVLSRHVAVDIGVAEVATIMAARAGIAALLGNVSRLVCDLNREPEALALVPETSDDIAIPGNIGADRAARIARFHTPYHAALEDLLQAAPPALIVSLHSFTPRLASGGAPRPWQVGLLYNEDERAARLAIPLLEAEGLVVGDQQPYSGRDLNYTMNRHAEADGRPYMGIEVRQDEISDPAGQAAWAERLARISNEVALKLSD